MKQDKLAHIVHAVRDNVGFLEAMAVYAAIEIASHAIDTKAEYTAQYGTKVRDLLMLEDTL